MMLLCFSFLIIYIYKKKQKEKTARFSAYFAVYYKNSKNKILLKSNKNINNFSSSFEQRVIESIERTPYSMIILCIFYEVYSF